MICKIDSSFQKVNVSRPILLVISVAMSLTEAFVVFPSSFRCWNFVFVTSYVYTGIEPSKEDTRVCVCNIFCWQRMRILCVKIHWVKQKFRCFLSIHRIRCGSRCLVVIRKLPHPWETNSKFIADFVSVTKTTAASQYWC